MKIPMDSLRELERERGISFETLVEAIEKALGVGLPEGHRTPTETRGARSVDRPRDRRRHRLRPGHRDRPRNRRDHGAEGVGGHARGLRPDRRSDRQAGDPPAPPRGRARHDVRRVLGPRGRHRHGDRAAAGPPLHDPRPRQDRGPHAAAGADPARALRARRAPQGLHRRGAQVGAWPPDHRVAHPPRTDQATVRARGARDPRRDRRDQGGRARARPPLEDRRRLATTATSIRSEPASGSRDRACAWS